MAARLSQRLQAWTGARWGVSVVNHGGAPSVAEQRTLEKDAAHAQARENPLVQAVLAAFPGAKISEIRAILPPESEAASAALPEVEDEWDPFESE